MFFKSKGLLGINARNLLYIRPYNANKAIKLADDKIKTKQFLSARGIPVPKLYKTIKKSEEIETFDFGKLPTKFVIKPNHGYGGEGIIPIVGRSAGSFITASGKKLEEHDLFEHLNDIIDGRFSISNIRDTAFFEQLIISDERVAKYSYAGLPDIRVVVHNLIPVMAMLRLPTQESGGKANLHMGAVGVGIDISKGECTYITHHNKIVEEIPDNLGSIRGFKIPYWDDILHISSEVQLLTNLGYMAVDLSIDKNVGPVLLEINARAGLGVQVANLAPLRKRLERIEGVKVTSPKKGVRIAKDMFGNTVEKEIAQLSGKQVISTEEEVEIIQEEGLLKLAAKVNTARDRSVMDYETAEKSGILLKNKNYDPEKHTLKLKLVIKKQRIKTIVDLRDRSNKKFKFSIGRRDLKNFLIDTSATRIEPEAPKSTKKSEILQIRKKMNANDVDQKIMDVDRDTKLLYYLHPINLKEETDKFFKNTDYNPQFTYRPLKFSPEEALAKLEKIETDETPLGKLLAKKKQAVINKINLLTSIDKPGFTKISQKIYGRPSKEEYEKVVSILNKVNVREVQRARTKLIYDDKAAQNIFMQVFKKYKLKHWKVVIKENMVARCLANKNNILFIRRGSKFSEESIKNLIIHEIETHILTSENGKFQPYEILNRGTADYLTTQEGLAMYNVEQQSNQIFNENYNAHGLVMAIYESMKHPFVTAYNNLRALGIPRLTAYKIVLKAKRGYCDTSKPGAFTKDYIYYKGYHEIKEFVAQGGEIKDLYIGKLNHHDLDLINQISNIRTPNILPHWLKK
ncbi:hypothetical protein CVV38_03020 [Candidatus Peregrinibacteria bacterium HGW-Peregrinibacteria-1]|jgi:alpha-L-glutamate ligase-like protein/uncharacterized protein (TIGR02421 family)|nr:MAG: hypothetical protein CVV38_03020 [Candidatus Peregrinibacteria bacterium HGW-Peregrinibacteria-1]